MAGGGSLQCHILQFERLRNIGAIGSWYEVAEETGMPMMKRKVDKNLRDCSFLLFVTPDFCIFSRIILTAQYVASLHASSV